MNSIILILEWLEEENYPDVKLYAKNIEYNYIGVSNTIFRVSKDNNVSYLSRYDWVMDTLVRKFVGNIADPDFFEKLEVVLTKEAIHPDD